MKIVALLAITILSSCVSKGEVLPIYDQKATQFCTSECPSPEDTATALQITDSLLMLWGYPHTSVFERIHIEWNEYDGGKYLGLTPQKSIIQIWDTTPGDVKGSAFAHELIHVALWEHYDDPDSDHFNILFDSKDGNPSVEAEADKLFEEYNL